MNEKIIDVSRLIAEFMRDIEVKLDTILLEQYQKYSRLGPEVWWEKQNTDVRNLARKLVVASRRGQREAVQVIRKGSFLAYEYARDPDNFSEKLDELAKNRLVRLPRPVLREIDFSIVFAIGFLRRLTDQKLRLFKRQIGVMYQKSIITTEPAKSLYEEILKRSTVVLEGQRKLTPLTGGLGVRKSLELGVRKTLQDVSMMAFDEAEFVFVLCSEHGDCAKDHKDHQGKVYYNDRWRDFIVEPNLVQKIQNHINMRGMRSYQWVKGEPVKMWTRWNCRHKLKIVPISDVLGMTYNDLLNKNNFSTRGRYQAKKYEKLQKQRYFERNVRKYDERIAIMEGAGDPNPMALQKQKILKRKWSGKVNSLVKGNSSYLYRARDREKARRLMFDYGVKYTFEEMK